MSSFGLNGGPVLMLGGRVLFEIIITSFVAVQFSVMWSGVMLTVCTMTVAVVRV